MNIQEFERLVFELEEIKLIIRGPRGAEVEDYGYARQASGQTSVTKWLNTRVRERLGDFEFSVIGGDFTEPHGRTKLSTLRSSYEK